LKSKPLLKNFSFLKTFLLIFILSSTFFNLPLPPFHSLAYALDEGGATVGIEYRSVNRETSNNNTTQYEMDYHLDVWQKVPNIGNLSLWLDWINGRDDVRINKLGSGFLALRDFRSNGFILNGLVGDSSLIFTNLPEKFSNAVYPDIYFRGFKADLVSKWGSVEVFGGKVARLEGLLGKTYDITDEFFYGFKGNFRPIPRLLVGTGFIRTQDEADSADKPVTKNNNIFLFDSEMEVFKWMMWQTEFRRSDFKGESGTESQSDYLLRFGPIVKTEKFKLEANYRRIGTDYRFVNQATQGGSDQEGLFLLAEYRPWEEITFFGNADRYHDNVSDKPDLNRIDNTRGLIGLSFFSLRYPSFYLTFDMTDQKTRLDFPSPVNNLTSTFFSEVRYEFKDFNPYVRYRRVDYKDTIQPANGYNQNDLTLGLRKNLRQGSILYIEGESNQKEYSGGGKESDLSGKIGFNYYLSANLSCWGEAIYSKLKGREEDTQGDKIEGALGLTAQLPWNIQVYSDIRYDQILNPQPENLKSRGLQANLRVMKKFNWGKREKVAGLKPGTETEGYGIVEGVVFNDINRNGAKEKGEEGVKEITIRLEDGSTVKTDEKGYYQFSRVAVGRHLVTLDVRRISADYSIICPEKVWIEVKLREMARVNFQLIAAARMEGRVINDLNNNGKIDPGEKGMSDALILLAPGNNNAYTDEDGKFIFENILPGKYKIRLDLSTLPEDSVFTSPEELPVDVPVGGELKDMNFLIYVKPRPIMIGPPKE
jgi:predicted porin